MTQADYIREAQALLGVSIDGVFGEKTLRALQTALGATLVEVKPDRFSICLTETLKHEGGWADHPSDPGGATMKGVTLATYRQFKPNATKADLRRITDAELKTIYRKGYWDKVRGDDLPAGVDLMTFDVAVNSGPRRAAEWLQEAVGATQDGLVGDKTLEKVALVSPKALVEVLSTKRDRFYRSLSTFPTFGKGWMRRLEDVTKKAREMAG